VKNRFQSLPFKCNLQRYTAGVALTRQQKAEEAAAQQPPPDHLNLTPADHMFRGLLVYVAALEAFAHGANDTANSTGPMSAMWQTYEAGLYGAGAGRVALT
jgi:phosphate/sulfate permease